MKREYEGIYNWNEHRGIPAPIRQPRQDVQIDDETLRDGLQGTQVKHHPDIEQRKIYIETASNLRFIDHADIGFPESGQLHKDAMIGIIQHIKDRKLGVTLSGAGRGPLDDLLAILEVADITGYPLEADLFFDPTHLRARVQPWDRRKMFELFAANIKLAKREGLPVMVVPERASSSTPAELSEFLTMAVDSGADRIGIADTAGVLTPYGTSQILREVFHDIGTRYPEVLFDFHEHDDLGMGLANCVVAANEGIDRLHATARGIGERAGNVNLERLLVALHLQGFRDVDTKQIQKFARIAADILHVPIQPHEPIVGENSTETASGIHANTYMRQAEEVPPIYTPYHPEDVGLKLKVRIGPLSGRANVDAVCKENGIAGVTDEQATQILDEARRRGGLLEVDDVLAILERK